MILTVYLHSCPTGDTNSRGAVASSGAARLQEAKKSRVVAPASLIVERRAIGQDVEYSLFLYK